MIFSYLLNMQSHPSWVCGLKQYLVLTKGYSENVTPFVGVWIETATATLRKMVRSRHTLRGCVD